MSLCCEVLLLEQHTKEWHAWRRAGVTASDLPAIMGISPYVTRGQLMAQKRLGQTPGETYAMRRGTRMEPVARRRCEGLMRRDYPPACVQNVEQGWMRASLDGLSKDGQILEIKCPNWRVHEEAMVGLIPAHYLAQVQWQLLVTGADICHYVTYSTNVDYTPVQQLAVVEVLPDPEMQASLLEGAERFYAELMGQVQHG